MTHSVTFSKLDAWGSRWPQRRSLVKTLVTKHHRSSSSTATWVTWCHLSHDCYDISHVSLRWKVYHLFLSIAKGNGPDSYAGRLCARGKAVSAVVRSMTWHTGFSIRRMRIWLGQDSSGFSGFWLFWDHLQDKRRTRRCSIWNSASRGDLHIVQMFYMTFSIYSQNQLDLRSYYALGTCFLLTSFAHLPCGFFSVSSCVAVLQERQELRELLGGPEGGGVVTCRDMSCRCLWPCRWSTGE